MNLFECVLLILSEILANPNGFGVGRGNFARGIQGRFWAAKGWSSQVAVKVQTRVPSNPRAPLGET